MVKITKVSVMANYRLEVAFDDGVRGVVDLSDLVGKGIFALWRDPDIFEKVQIGSFGELIWLDKIDLCPDSLYLKVTGKNPEEVFPSLYEFTKHFRLLMEGAKS
jgi:hypothetical protein